MAPTNVHSMVTRFNSGIFWFKAFVSSIDTPNSILVEPKTYREAMKNELWLNAMNKEIAAL